MKYDGMSVNELHELYKNKYLFVKKGNLPELIKLKKNYPEIFDEKKEQSFKELVETTEFLLQMPHIQANILADKKKRLVPMDFDDWKLGMVDQQLSQLDRIGFDDMLNVARAFVKESIVLCQSVCRRHGFNIEIFFSFPLLSHLINEILVHFPLDKRPYQLKATLFKLRGGEKNSTLPSDSIKSALSEWENAILTHAEIKEELSIQFRAIFKNIRMKFDHREGFYTDALFYYLLETSEFIGLLIPTLGNMGPERQSLMIQLMENTISITYLSNVISHPIFPKSN